MINKVAILIDGGFFSVRFRDQNKGVYPKVNDVEKLIDETLRKIQAKSNPSITDVIFRNFYYDCKPFGEDKTDPNGKEHNFSYQNSKSHQAIQFFQNDLRRLSQMALRLGELSFDGWTTDPKKPNEYKPILKQKSVDMKIGLDIAWLASKKIVDKLVLVAGDSDFISPMKFARREGLLVYLETMGQPNIKLELMEHADFLL